MQAMVGSEAPATLQAAELEGEDLMGDIGSVMIDLDGPQEEVLNGEVSDGMRVRVQFLRHVSTGGLLPH